MAKLDLTREFSAFYHEKRTPVYGQDGLLFSPTGTPLGNTERDLHDLNRKGYAITTHCRRYVVNSAEQTDINAQLDALRAEYEKTREERLRQLEERLRSVEEQTEIFPDIEPLNEAPEPVPDLDLTDIEKEALAKIAVLPGGKKF